MKKVFQAIAPGVTGLLQSAVSDERNPEATYSFGEGDLAQMAAQKKLLLEHGIEIFMNNVYPCVKTEKEYKKGLGLIWEKQCEGWWNFSEKFMQYKICTPQEYVDRLNITSENRERILKNLQSKYNA